MTDWWEQINQDLPEQKRIDEEHEQWLETHKHAWQKSENKPESSGFQIIKRKLKWT